VGVGVNMTPDEADHLGKRIINSFRGGPPLTDWREVLEPLDAGKAGTAYMRLRSATDAPSVKQFMDEYRKLDTTPTTTTGPCTRCDDTRFVPGPDIVHNAGTDHERRYSTVEPCRHCNRRSAA
jgi:hypothetical protein